MSATLVFWDAQGDLYQIFVVNQLKHKVRKGIWLFPLRLIRYMS